MSPLSRFLGFARRFAPFWLVWLVIAALPASREPLRLQLWGSPLTPRLNPPWREDLRPDSRFDAFAAAARNSGDLNARVWRFGQMLESKSGGFDERGEQNGRSYRPGELKREARAIRDAFPEQPWLSLLPVRALNFPWAQWRELRQKLPDDRAAEVVSVVREAARLEPGNAFYALLEADVWWQNHNSNAMWRALNRAAGCRTFDTHSLEWARATVRAHHAARPLLLEEREALWRTYRAGNWGQSADWPQILTNDLWRARKEGDSRRLIAVGTMLAHLGDLMQRGTNTRETAQRGAAWKLAAWNLVPRPKTQRDGGSKDFESYAAAHGRPDVAALTRKWQARQSQLHRLSLYVPGAAPAPPAPPKDAFVRVEEWRNAGLVVGVHLLWVAAMWVFVAGILWRGVGAPASRADRTVPALTLAALATGGALWAWRQFEWLDAMRWTPTKTSYQVAVATVAAVAFVGPPFLLAVWAAAATMWQHRREFLKPARIETELRLSPGQVIILRSGPTIVCAAALVFTLVFWALYLGLVALNVLSVDLLGWLPNSGKGTPSSLSMPTEALFAPILYLLLIDLVAWLVWFNKWRYYAGKESRPLTHGGLRRWKEMLGVYLVLGSAVFLGVSLAGWPHRAQAARELETRMTRGELPP